jgi:hypothetical protein
LDNCAHLALANLLALRKRIGLRALARSKTKYLSKLDQRRSTHLSTFNQTHVQTRIRSESTVMPLIEIPPQGKDVAMTIHLPEQTATDVKLYARFLKAPLPSAASAIITECIRRTLKQDTEFQSWKSDPTNTKSKRGGVRPRKTTSPSPPLLNKSEAGAKAL